MIRLANDAEYAAAAVAVAAGTASDHQIWLNDQMAKVAGTKGERARDAQKKAGKR